MKMIHVRIAHGDFHHMDVSIDTVCPIYDSDGFIRAIAIACNMSGTVKTLYTDATPVSPIQIEELRAKSYEEFVIQCEMRGLVTKTSPLDEDVNEVAKENVLLTQRVEDLEKQIRRCKAILNDLNAVI